MNARKVLLVVAIAGVCLLVTASMGLSASSGIMRSGTSPSLPAEGCICHGENSHGTPNQNVKLLFQLDPLESLFTPNRVYNLTVGASDSDVDAVSGENQGGFNLLVSVGKLAAGPGYADFVQVAASGKEATHTAAGDKNGRTYKLTWQAPATADEPAVFTLFANTVDGDGAPTAADHYNGGTFVVWNKPGASVGGAAEEVNPEHYGVKWLAHWVGIVSFLAVFATLLIYYFVLKYGESVHTTDHRDRKEK